MTDEKSEPTPEPNSFMTVRHLIEKGGIPIRFLATAIEDDKTGIYTWDRFRRFGKADPAATEGILDLLAAIYKYEDTFAEIMGDTHPLEEAAKLWDDPSKTFGWYREDLPDFKALAERDNATGRGRLPPTKESPQLRGAATKTQNTHLLIIGALCNKLKIDYSDSARGAATTIQGLLDEIGIQRDDGTIRAVLGKVREAVDANAD